MSLEILGRTWQDVVLSAGSLVFFISLIPALRGPDKPPVSTGLLTGGMLTVYGLIYATLGLWLSLGGAFLVAGAWYALALQKWLCGRERGSGGR